MKKQLFTLLTLVVMCATGAWANHRIEVSGATVTETWDFGEYTTQVILADDNKTITYEGLTLVGSGTANYTNDYVSSTAGFHMNGASSATTRHIKYRPVNSGKLTVTYRSNNATATDRITAIGTEVSTFSDTGNPPETVLACGYTDGANNKTIEADLTAGTDYYVFFASGGQGIFKLVYVYTLPAPTNPTVSVEEGNITGGSEITINSTNASAIYYYWSDSSIAPAAGNVAYTSASGASVEVTAPNVTGTRYLHTYGYNATGTTSVASFAYSITKTQLPAGLAYTTSSIEKNIGDANFTNELSNPNSLNVTYSITSNGTGSSIDSSTGEVTVGSQAGTETITATFAGSDEYLEGQAEYTLTVNEPFTVTFEIGDGTGVAPAAVGEITKGTSITLPRNFTMYKEGYTMTGWSDGTDTYATGTSYTVNGDVTLTAQYTANTVSLEDRTKAVTITFDFRRENGAPTVQWGEGSGDHVWVTQATVAGKTIDVKADINVTASGKVANAGWTDWVQINNTTEIAVPSENGATIKIYAFDENNATTVNGKTKDSYASNVYTYNVTGDGSTAQIVMDKGTGNAYYKYIEVTLPSTSEVLSATELNTQFVLTKENINSYDFVSVSTENWNTNKTYGAYSGDFYNMSSTDRKITMKVTGASLFEVFVQNTNSGRGYTVKIGNNEAVTVNHGGSGMESSGVFAIDDATATTTIVISGTGNSVYPVYAMFNPAVSTTITPTGYATFSSPYALDFSGTIENLDAAYYASAVAPGSVTMTELNQTVPAETGLFLKGKADETVTIPVAASGTDINGDNYLKANTTESQIAASAGGTYHYVFAYTASDNSNPGFFNLGSALTLGAGKAYLETTTNIKPTAQAKVSILFTDSEFTGISNVNANDSLNANTNADKMYNTAGQLVGENYKGIVIVNGMKTVK